jgi:hypothetical protein
MFVSVVKSEIMRASSVWSNTDDDTVLFQPSDVCVFLNNLLAAESFRKVRPTTLPLPSLLYSMNTGFGILSDAFVIKPTIVAVPLLSKT